jgi:hypothetical protein
MKQRISVEGLKSLTPSQQEKLREWWKPQEGDIVYWQKWGGVETVIIRETKILGLPNYDLAFNDGYNSSNKSQLLPLLSIGQCIEILEDKSLNLNNVFIDRKGWETVIWEQNKSYRSEELIDALWEAVKSIL